MYGEKKKKLSAHQGNIMDQHSWGGVAKTIALRKQKFIWVLMVYSGQTPKLATTSVLCVSSQG